MFFQLPSLLIHLSRLPDLQYETNRGSLIGKTYYSLRASIQKGSYTVHLAIPKFAIPFDFVLNL